MSTDKEDDRYLAGKVDVKEITLAEYLEECLFEMVDSGSLHLERPVAHQGSIYLVHTCVRMVIPPELTEKLVEMKN